MLGWVRRLFQPAPSKPEADPAPTYRAIHRAQLVRLEAERRLREFDDIHRRAEEGPFPFLGDTRQGKQ
jgi:hypothetical protein